MGVLNLTPDSFSDGGDFFSLDQAVAQALAMAEDGAAIIDIGGESTRPQAEQITVEEELRRVIPVIEALQNKLSIPISIDTCKPEVMAAAVHAGASMINDVTALASQIAQQTALSLKVPVCLMHMQGQPETMQNQPHYQDPVKEITHFFSQKTDQLLAVGFAKENLLIDPGFGFGKTLTHNIALLKHLNQLHALGFPVLIGLSRKTMIGDMLKISDPKQRGIGSVAANIIAVQNGAHIVRVHDVKATVQALKIVQYCS